MKPIVSEQAFDLISIGGGSGGLACAQRAAEYGAKAAVIEPHRLGGTCVNVGCVPKKVMWNAASVALSLQDAADYGFDVTVGESRLGGIEAQARCVRAAFERRSTNAILPPRAWRYVRGAARFVDAHSVLVNGQRFSARHIVIATGGKAMLPPIPGAEFGISSDGFFDLESRPQRVAVVGSGYIACELAASFLELGSQVEQFIRKDRLLTQLRCHARQVADAGSSRSRNDHPGTRHTRRAARAVGQEDSGGREMGASSQASIACSGRSAEMQISMGSTGKRPALRPTPPASSSRMVFRIPRRQACMRSAMSQAARL